MNPPPAKSRKIIFWSALLTLLLVAGGVLYVYYPKWKARRLITRAEQALARSDIRNAYLPLFQVLQAQPDNLEACKLMTKLVEQNRFPQTIYWYRRLSELEPQVLEHRLRWARAALQHKEPGFAEQALNSVDVASRNTAAYQHVKASLALAKRQFDEAEIASAAAAQLEPNNPVYQLNLATVQMQSTNQAKVQEAKQRLELLKENPRLRSAAMRALISTALASKDIAKALELSNKLHADSKLSFSDQLIHLEILGLAQDPGFNGYLKNFQEYASQNASYVLGLSGWLLSQGKWTEAHTWLKNLPERLLAEPLVQRAMVECLIFRKDWAGIEDYLKGELWEDSEFIRLAILARAAREQEHTTLFKPRWSSALQLAYERHESLAVLLRLASEWQWEDETHDLLWTIARGRHGPQTALTTLYRYYQAKSDTKGLYQVLLRMIELNPADDIAKNNWVTVSLLLRISTASAHQQALELYKKNPDNPIFASTFALSLHLQGRTSEGLTLFSNLKPEQLRHPSIAAYHAILLSATGPSDKLKECIDLAKSARLLPEERALLAEAERTSKLL